VQRRATRDRRPCRHTTPWRRELGVVLGLTVATWLIARAGWLDGFETAGLDAFLIARPRLEASHVVVVEINDEDYERLFLGTSPLNPTVLRRVLEAIARGRPAVVGIDLDTDPREVAGAAPGTDEPLVWPAAVWAVIPRSRDCPSEEALGVPTGVPALPLDRDGVIRRYFRRVPLHGCPGAPIDSLQWAVLKVYCATAVEDPACRRLVAAPPDEELLLNFTGDGFDFPRMSVATLLEASKGAAWGTERGPLVGRIVLLGGVYRAARDEHLTPLGETTGAFVIAQAIESELQGRGIRPLNEFLMAVMELVGGVVIVLLHKLPVRWAFRASLVGTPLLAATSSFVAFHSLSRWASFAPVLLGVLLHELYEGAKLAETLSRDSMKGSS